MKTLRQNRLPSFQTKKKLSNARHVHWIIAFVVAIGLGYILIMVEFIKMHDRKVMFYNLRTVNLNINKSSLDKGKFDNNSPLFIVYEDKVVFGSAQSVVLPKLEKDSLILNKSILIEDFKQKIGSYKNNKRIFPAKNVGISFANNLDYSQQIAYMNQIFTLIRDENKKNIGEEISPSIILVDTLSSP